MTLTYGSVCSGIEAASVAWKPLGWATSFVSEIEAAPRAILQHRFPEVPLHGDFTTIREGEYGAIDLLVGGTPCQSFSVAGLRGGLADDRGNLALEYLRLAQRLRPRWLVWENVPGVLSSNGGRDFGAILGGMVELGYEFAYRVLDAQYVRVDGFGRAVPQRRRRVFVVGHLGDWRRPAAVLFERACLRGDPAPRREAGAGIADSLEASLGRRCGQPSCGSRDGHLIAGTLGANHGNIRAEQAWTGQLVAHSLRGEGFDASEDGTGRGTPIVPVAFQATGDGYWRQGIGPLATSDDNGTNQVVAFDTTQITSAQNRNNPRLGDPCHPLAAGAHAPAIAFSCKDHGADATDAGVTPTLRAMGHGESHANAGGQLAVAFDARQSDVLQYGPISGPLDTDPGTIGIYHRWLVRRLLPVECERLQGFEDGHTLVPWRGGLMPDGPRYKMLGNSMAVNVMRWIGRRIEAVDALEVAPALMAAE